MKGKIEEVLNNAVVLLISDKEEEYEELQKKGFKKIDYFKSIISAKNYLLEHEELIDQYDIVLFGPSIVDECMFQGFNPYQSKIEKLFDRKKIFINDHYYHYTDNSIKSLTLDDLSTENFSLYLDKIVIKVIEDNILKREERIENYVPKFIKNRNNITIPTSKKDLKVLILLSGVPDTKKDELRTEFGFDSLEIKSDNNIAIDIHVEELGDYDIILASELYSRKLLRLIEEANIQSQQTGRGLVMLATYEETPWDGLKIEYKLSGCLNNTLPSKTGQITLETTRYICINNELAKDIIEVTISEYERLFNSLGKSNLSFGLKTAEEKNEMYRRKRQLVREEKEKKQRELNKISNYDSIIRYLEKYIIARQNYFKCKKVSDMDITYRDNIYTVTLYSEERAICEYAFHPFDENDTIRTFAIRLLNKKGNLSNPSYLGIYTSDHKDDEDVPRLPNEKEEAALSMLRKRIDKNLLPIIEEIESLKRKGYGRNLHRKIKKY